MVLNRVLEPHIVGTADSTVFRRHLCEWVLPQEVATKVKYNSRRVPAIIRRETNEDHYLRLAIARICDGQWSLRFEFGSGYSIKPFGDTKCSRSLLPPPTYT